MRKPITPYAHGMLDYGTTAMLMAAPRLMKFPKRAARVSYALAGSYAGLSMLTDYPLGVKRAIPFKAHGVAEAVIGAVLPAVPWVLRFARYAPARYFFLGLTGMTVVAAALTDWNKESERRARRRHKRKPRLRAA